MATLEELQLKAADLRNIRIADWLSKRSSSFPYGWHQRYVVLSGNFLFIYSAATDIKPRRVICVDDCVATSTDKYSRKKPFAFVVPVRGGREYFFAAESAAEAGKWTTAITNASYSNMYQRTRDAVKFLDRCKALVAPFAAAASAAGGTALSARALLHVDAEAANEETVTHLKASMTGADVLDAIQHLRDAQAAARAALADAGEGHGRGGSSGTGADASSPGRSTGDVSALKARVDELSARNTELQTRVETLNRELTNATSAATRAATRLASTTGSSTHSSSKEDKTKDAAETALLREREELTSTIRHLQAQLEIERKRTATATAAAAVSPGGAAASRPSTAAEAASPRLIADAVSIYEHEWARFLTEAQRLEKEKSYADAEQQYEAVLQVKMERVGAESVAVASACRDLGRVLALQRRFDRAEEYYSRAVRLCSKLLGESHPNTACALTDLAAVLREQGKFEDAETYAARAVASLKEGVGPDDVSTATALYNLAGLAKRQGKYAAAESAYGEALRIFRATLGEGQGETADTLYQMGCLYRKRNEWNKAGSLFQQAAASYAKTYGPGDKRVAEASKRAKGMLEKVEGSGAPVSAGPAQVAAAAALDRRGGRN